MSRGIGDKLHEFHAGILKAHWLYLKQIIKESLRDLSTDLSEGIYRRTSRQLRKAIDETSDTDHTIRRLIETSDFSAQHAAKVVLPEDPKQLHAFWSNLSRKNKDELYRADLFIGNRDGVPHIDRDYYNQQTLAVLQDLATSAGDAEALARLGKIANALGSPDGAARRYLVRFDDQFRSAVSVGNPDTAKYVVTYVGGAGSVPRLSPEKCEQLRQAAWSVDPKAEVAVISWSGDSAPNVQGTIDAAYARNGAPLLRDFQEGLRVTHEGPPSHNTVIGFSYGGLNVGHAAMQPQPLDADAVVFVGSFGTGVEHAADLRLVGIGAADMDRHVFSTLAEHDPVQLLPRPHGPAPTSPGFGGTVFSTDSTPGVAQEGDPLSSMGWNPAAHHSYWDSNNPAIRDMGLIITGNGHLVG